VLADLRRLLVHEALDQPRLADAGLADDGDEASLAELGRAQGAGEFGQLRGAADEGAGGFLPVGAALPRDAVQLENLDRLGEALQQLRTEGGGEHFVAHEVAGCRGRYAPA